MLCSFFYQCCCVQDIRPLKDRFLCPCTDSFLLLALPGLCVPALLCLWDQVREDMESGWLASWLVCSCTALPVSSGESNYGIRIACLWLHLLFNMLLGGAGFVPPSSSSPSWDCLVHPGANPFVVGPLAWLCPGMYSPIVCPV